MAEAALSVGFHGTQRRIAPHTTNSANLAKSFLVATRSVSGKRSCLAHHVDTACARNGGLRMLVGGLGIKINQLPSHHQVTGNDVTIGPRKGGQGAQSIAVEFIGTDTGGNRRLVTVGRNVLIRRGVVLVTAVVTRRTPASAILEAAAAVVAALVATAVPTTIIARTKVTAVVPTTLETATLTITTIVTTEAAALAAVLETAAAVVAALVATAVPTTIITRTKITAVVVTPLETATLTITTEASTAIITTLETTSLATVGAFAIAIAPLRLALLVSTTAEFAASSSLFCHGVYPLFLRR